nr:Zn(2)-Cys(6)53 [Trametes gibbosa]
MADNCTEGHRKKAKYLLDEEELEALKRSKSGDGSAKTTEPSAQPQHPPPPSEQSVQPPQYITPDTMFPTYQTPGSYGIPAEAANLEYSILSAILGGSPDSGSSGSPATGPAPQPVASTSYAPPPPPGLSNSTSWPSEPLSGQYAAGQPAAASTYSGVAAPAYAGGAPTEYVAPAATTGYAATYPQSAGAAGSAQYTEYSAADQSQAQAQGAQTTSAAYTTSSSAQSPTTTSFLSRGRRNPSSPTAARLVPNWAGSPMSVTTLGEGTVQSVYKSVTKGYDYTQGYHFLMKHMSRRFDKNDILRIVRALAIVRPSFIALQMPMSEEDDVFVEKCFQRSLIELDKLVSFSGTPTVAWRRTGEICLVGPEFCMLTGWEREELVGRRKYIYELFENQSVVEYWENFANHAFENTTQSVYSHCVLLKPSGAPVPCTFCFSIRRDIMDLPSLVIGQWLPLL